MQHAIFGSLTVTDRRGLSMSPHVSAGGFVNRTFKTLSKRLAQSQFSPSIQAIFLELTPICKPRGS